VNTEETRAIVGHIDVSVRKIRNRININTVIFSLVFLLVLFIAWISWGLARSAIISSKVASDANIIASTNSARLDAQQNQYIDYISQMITFIDKLQKDNRQIKVPKAIWPRPPGAPAPVESDLDRPRYEHPGAGVTPAPQTKTRTIVKYKTKRPSPTPKPWYQFFKSTR
jgi:hypothetical protein